MVKAFCCCSFFLFRYFLLFIFIIDFVQGASHQYHRNLSRCGVNVCSDSSAETSASKIFRLDQQDIVTLPVKYTDEGHYVVKLGLGTPKTTLTFSIQTYVNISWTQCQPCSSCYKQTDPIFNPSKSSSYSTVPCTSPSCVAGCSSSDACSFHYKDGDNTVIDGELSTDVVSLDEKVSVKEFVFGCGTSNYLGLPGTVAGYFGLRTGPLSFLTMYKETFSYCLPLKNSLGFLSFGGDGLTSNAATFVPFSGAVPLSINDISTNYVLDLAGVSVGGKALSTSLSVEHPLPILLDSGTSVTRFTGEIYAVLRDDFRRRMSKYPLVKETLSPVLDTCFDVSGHTNVPVPAIEFTFSNGIVVPLKSSGILYDWNSTVSCFPFSVVGDGNSNYAIFGAVQQSTFEIIYDNPNKRIGFSKNRCSKEEPFKPIASSAATLALPPAAAVAMNLVMALALLFNRDIIS